MGVLLLDSINQPADLKQLNEKQVEQLCEGDPQLSAEKYL